MLTTTLGETVDVAKIVVFVLFSPPLLFFSLFLKGLLLPVGTLKQKRTPPLWRRADTVIKDNRQCGGAGRSFLREVETSPAVREELYFFV